MTRIALGFVAAFAVSSLTANAQTGLVDAARLSRLVATDQGASITNGADSTAALAVPATVAPLPSPAARLAGAPRFGPTLVRKASPSDPESPLAPQTAKERRGMKYMLIGAGVLITGAIIDDDAGDILMVGGVVISFYGLWIFLN